MTYQQVMDKCHSLLAWHLPYQSSIIRKILMFIILYKHVSDTFEGELRSEAGALCQC